MLLLVLGAMLQAAAPAAANRDGDGRCLAAFSYLAAQDDADSVEMGKNGSLFFVGKLRGREPEVDLTAVLRKAAGEIEPIFRAEMERCTTELRSAGTAMVAAGQALRR